MLHLCLLLNTTRPLFEIPGHTMQWLSNGQVYEIKLNSPFKINKLKQKEFFISKIESYLYLIVQSYILLNNIDHAY